MAEQKELEQCADFHIHEEIVEKVVSACRRVEPDCAIVR